MLQKKLLHVRQCAKSLGVSPTELALLTQESGCLPGTEEEEDFSVGRRKKVKGAAAEEEGKPPVVTGRKRRARRKEELM